MAPVRMFPEFYVYVPITKIEEAKRVAEEINAIVELKMAIESGQPIPF